MRNWVFLRGSVEFYALNPEQHLQKKQQDVQQRPTRAYGAWRATCSHASCAGLVCFRPLSAFAVFSDTKQWVSGKYCSVLRIMISCCFSSLIGAREAMSSPAYDMRACSAWHAVHAYIPSHLCQLMRCFVDTL